MPKLNEDTKDNIIAIVLVAAIIIALVAIGSTVFGAPKEDKEDKKVTICHATSSETNPYTRIVVSENAIGGHFDNPGTPKAGHEDDILLEGEQDCPGPETPPREDEKPSDEDTSENNSVTPETAPQGTIEQVQGK